MTANGQAGSPPRVRGKLLRAAAVQLMRRITPACAGKTSSHTPACSRGRDHPRVCGENCCMHNKGRGMLGSPPRVRGKRRILATHLPAPRITPACAGKTIAETLGRDAKEDHPRVCGENSLRLFSHATMVGSPPRVRGKLPSSPLPTRFYRITPACAGKTRLMELCACSCKDHPRVCGENRKIWLLKLSERGSPPRVRGKHSTNLRNQSSGRITPACAGKTFNPCD